LGGGEGLGISFSLDNLISFNFQDGGDSNVSDCYHIDKKIIYDFVRNLVFMKRFIGK
jgi:hypothetical protein